SPTGGRDCRAGFIPAGRGAAGIRGGADTPLAGVQPALQGGLRRRSAGLLASNTACRLLECLIEAAAGARQPCRPPPSKPPTPGVCCSCCFSPTCSTSSTAPFPPSSPSRCGANGA